MSERVGLAIVGGSAAGLAAAWSAARAGADVMLLEAKPVIAEPPAPAFVAFDLLWPARVARPAACVRRRLRGVRLRSPAGHALDVDAPLSLLDRAAFDRQLAKAAEDAGARIVTGVKRLRALPDRSLAAEGLDVRADVVIFADGAASLASGFLRPQQRPSLLAWGAVLEHDAPGADEDRLGITIGAHARGGRSQSNPLGNGGWSHWTFYRGEPHEAEERARVALALEARLRGWDETIAKTARFAGVAPDPVYTMPGELAADGILVAGGAAGQGGLEAGLSAGELAGRVAAGALARGRVDKVVLARYEREWKRANLAGYRALRQATGLLARLDDVDLDALLAPWNGRSVHAVDLLDFAHPARRVAAAARALWANPAALPALGRALARAAKP